MLVKKPFSIPTPFSYIWNSDAQKVHKMDRAAAAPAAGGCFFFSRNKKGMDLSDLDLYVLCIISQSPIVIQQIH